MRKHREIAVSLSAILMIFLYWAVLAQADQTDRTNESVVASGTLKESRSNINIPTSLALIGLGEKQSDYSSGQPSEALALQKEDSKKFVKPVGTIAQMHVQPGDRVKIGDLLFAVDDAEAKAVFNEASARYEVIERSIEKLGGKRVDFPPNVSKNMVTMLKRQDQAKIVVRMAKKALDATIVKATGSGVVKDLRIGEGSVVYAGQPAMSVVESEILSVDIFVPVYDAKKIKKGQAAEVRVDAAPETVFEGIIEVEAAQAGFAPSNMASNELELLRVIKITLEVKNKDDILKAGMPADITIRQSR